MSHIYDNWERLVAAVVKREEIRQICHAPSLSSSTYSSISDSIPSSSNQFDEDLIPAKAPRPKFSEEYEPVNVGRGVGSKEIKKSRFSWKKIFNGKAAETWLYNSKEKGRLVAAVLIREIWELCHAPSISPSISSIFSYIESSSSSQFDENSESAKSEVQESASQVKDEQFEIYKPGLAVTIVALKDGSNEVKRVHFSKGRFTEKTAETSWFSNRENVYKKYNDHVGLAQLRQTSQVGSASKALNESTRSLNSDGRIVEERVENYIPGVGDFIDGSRCVVFLGFSSRRFKMHQVKDWWCINQHIVYKKYNAQGKAPLFEQSSEIKETANIVVIELIEQYATIIQHKRVCLRQEGKRLSMEYNGIPRLAMVKNPILETNFDEMFTSANLDGPMGELEWVPKIEYIERYEPGVYVSVQNFTVGIRDVARVRFRRNIFKQEEAVAWWVKNREKVYRKYRIQ